MIYQFGKLIIGVKWEILKGWGDNFISKRRYWLAGLLTYNPEERNLYFFEGFLVEGKNKDDPKTFVFNIDTTHFGLVKRGRTHVVYIKDKDNNEFLFESNISYYKRNLSTPLHVYERRLVYNQCLVNVINHLKLKEK